MELRMQIKSPATQYEIHFETLVPVVKMRTLIITIVVVSYVITVVESSLRPSKSKKMPFLLDEELSFDLRRRWQATERDRSMFSKSDGEKYSSKKEEMRKSDHYIDPKILKQLSGVNDIKDFVKKFKPKGFTIMTEKVLKKLPKTAYKQPDIILVRRAGIFWKSRGFSLSGSKISDDDYQEVERETVYYQGQRVADSLQSSSSSKDPCIPRNVTQSIGRLGVRSIPSCVVLKKCGGCCDGGRECVAVATTRITQPVIEISKTGFHVLKKDFINDLSCECGCIVKASDCLPTQTYSKDRCQCECQSSNQACPIGKHWSKAECNCICIKRPGCTSPWRKWDEDSCDCVCIDTPCPTGQSRSSENCQCS